MDTDPAPSIWRSRGVDIGFSGRWGADGGTEIDHLLDLPLAEPQLAQDVAAVLRRGTTTGR
jgi:hypothetical protein